MSSDTTRTKTLWSETQFDMLYLSLEKNRPDEQILEIVEDLGNRGFPPAYLVEKVQDRLGVEAAGRLRKLTGT